jgi:CRP/FNR family transcriptional regulator, cyclic AMP receptor protein
MTLSLDQKCDLLRGAKLFSDLDLESLRLVAGRAQEMEFPARHYIVRQGELGTGLYLIISGQARVMRNNEHIDTMGPGDSFGELAILDQSPRSATVQSTEPTVCLALASWEVTSLLEQHPKLALAMLRQVVQRLRPYLTHRH